MPLPNSRLLHGRFHEETRRSAVGDRGLPDSIRVDRATIGDGTTDPETGVWTPPAGALVAVLDCRIQLDTISQGRVVVVGEQVVQLHRYRCQVSHAAPQILVGDVVTVLSSADLQLPGRPLMVRDWLLDTFQVRRSLFLEDHPDLPTPPEEATDG